MLINNKKTMEEENKTIIKEDNIKTENFSIIKDVFKSKPFKISMTIVISLMLSLLVFELGVNVGFQKANFSYKWRDNYNNNITRRNNNCMEPPFNERNFGPEERGFVNSNGSAGEIIKINEDYSLIIKDIDNTEKNVVIDNNTTIREFKNEIKKEDLKIGQKVVVIGEPNDSGKIEAKLIRIMPEPINQNVDNTTNTK